MNYTALAIIKLPVLVSAIYASKVERCSRSAKPRSVRSGVLLIRTLNFTVTSVLLI